MRYISVILWLSEMFLNGFFICKIRHIKHYVMTSFIDFDDTLDGKVWWIKHKNTLRSCSRGRWVEKGWGDVGEWHLGGNLGTRWSRSHSEYQGYARGIDRKGMTNCGGGILKIHLKDYGEVNFFGLSKKESFWMLVTIWNNQFLLTKFKMALP